MLLVSTFVSKKSVKSFWKLEKLVPHCPCVHGPLLCDASEKVMGARCWCCSSPTLPSLRSVASTKFRPRVNIQFLLWCRAEFPLQSCVLHLSLVWQSFRLLWCSPVFSPARLQSLTSASKKTFIASQDEDLAVFSHVFLCAVSVVCVWPRISVSRWVDDDRASCSDHVHQCPVDFHQRFPVSGRSVSVSQHCAPVWRLVRFVGPLCQFCECRSGGRDPRGHLCPD